MSWQEELHRIDTALAAGKLTKDQYAAQREELLAKASSTSAPKPPSHPVKIEVQPRPPVPAKALLATDRPTTAPSPADERSTDSMPHPKVQPAAVSAPVRVINRTELPPPVPGPRLTPAPTAAAAAEPKERRPVGTARTWLFLGLGLLLVAALIGGGLWLLSGSDDARRPPAVAADPPAQPTLLPVAEIEGRQSRVARIATFADVEKLNYLTVPETRAYKGAHPHPIGFGYLELRSGSSVTILVVDCRVPGSAGTLARRLGDLQKELGARRLDKAPKGIELTSVTDPRNGHGHVRAHYKSGSLVVRIGIDSPRGERAARADLLTALNAQLDIHPADA